ncbi:MAG TPA: hypothetical protein PLK35_00470 [Candidatus Moranbacteria bacterium]|nr:hypothetical protein [Candidatus Moranbacteria bacterium]
MRDCCYIIFETVEEGTTLDGGVVLRSKGCNGENHMDFLHTVCYDQDGGVEWSDELAYINRGRCDHGWFTTSRRLC